MKNSCYLRECRYQRGVIIEIEHDARAIELRGESLDLLFGTATQDRPHAARDGFACDQFAGVTIGTVEKPGRGHEVLRRCGHPAGARP